MSDSVLDVAAPAGGDDRLVAPAVRGPRPVVDVMDSTWLRARPELVAPWLADPANWAKWWPGLTLRPSELRGPRGVRWHVDAVAGHPGLAGSAEVWLQAQGEGVVAHFFLRLDPTGMSTRAQAPGRRRGRRPERAALERIGDHYRRLTKQAFWTLADHLDPGRRQRAAHHRLH